MRTRIRDVFHLETGHFMYSFQVCVPTENGNRWMHLMDNDGAVAFVTQEERDEARRAVARCKALRDIADALARVL